MSPPSPTSSEISHFVVEYFNSQGPTVQRRVRFMRHAFLNDILHYFTNVLGVYRCSVYACVEWLHFYLEFQSQGSAYLFHFQVSPTLHYLNARREEDRVSIEKLADSAGVELHLMSNETEEGVQEVKTAACDKLLQARVDARMAGKKVGVMPWCVSIRAYSCFFAETQSGHNFTKCRWFSWPAACKLRMPPVAADFAVGSVHDTRQ